MPLPHGEAGQVVPAKTGPRPRSFDDGAGWFGGSEDGRLTGPSLYSLDVILLGPEAAHPGGQTLLDRVRRRGWCLGGGRSSGVGGGNTATGTAAKGAADERFLRRGLYHRIRPCRGDFRLGRAQRPCTNLCRAGTEHECCCDAARIGDTAGRDNRHIDRIDDRRP